MAKGKKKFQIETPRGVIYTQATKGGKVTARLDWNPNFKPNMESGFASAQEFVDSECIRRMNRRLQDGQEYWLSQQPLAL
jgi:hypothetical protein